MDITNLAFYAGYAFCQAVHLQSVLEPDALMVPFVVEWNGESALAKPYPANTQQEAVQLQLEAIQKIEDELLPWSAGRDGLLTLNDGSKNDTLVITSGTPGLKEELTVLHMYKTQPFSLVGNFLIQPPYNNFLKEKDGNTIFFSSFVEGVKAYRYGNECMTYVANKS